MDIHHAKLIDDMPGFLAQHGTDLLTDGHYGVPRDWMDAMLNLKLISNYGVGYDAIDVGLSVSRRIMSRTRRLC